MAGKIRVAVCDDARAVKFFLRQVLEEEGDIEVVAVASTGQEALEQLAVAATDVLLLDVLLPDVPEPAELMRELRERWPQTAVVLISNLAPPSLEREAERLAADGWIQKASKPGRMREGVRRAARAAPS